MLRIKKLKNELSEAQLQLHHLMSENRILKTIEKRQENAINKYEGTNAKLPQVIRAYMEEILSLKTRLKNTKSAYRKLEERNRLISTELSDVKKKHKHLLDLTKNKQLIEREQLSNQLVEAENTIRHQDTINQNLIKNIKLLNKNHRIQINVEINKAKVLQSELNHLKETNDQLHSKIEKLKHQRYSGRRSYAAGLNKSIASQSRSTVISKSSLLNGVVVDSSSQNPAKKVKSELVMKKKDLSDGCDESVVQHAEPNMAGNPFSLSDVHDVNSAGDHQSMATLKINDEELINAEEDDLQKDNSCSDDDDMSSITSVSDTEE